MNNQNRLRLSNIALCVAIAVGSVSVYAQNTTSAISGRVSAVDGKFIAGAQVKIVHIESGSVTNATTDADGRYAARGLRVGGPYTVTITKDGVTERRENVFLTLAETATLDAKLSAKVESIQVAASAISDVFSKNAMGAGTNIGRAELEGFGSINRNLQDYARTDPRLSQTDKERGEISAGGQNSRFNSITIDGVKISDPFGLEGNNLPTLKQPISIDAIQSVQINVSNYDVTQSGYTGANINAVTKSGTNDFKGSVYKVYRDHKLAGDRYSRATGIYTSPPPFSEDTKGFTLGGPIIKDKLFFFVAYEELASTRGSPSFGPIGSSAVNVGITPSAIAAAQSIASTAYRLDIGTSDIAPGLLTVKDLTAKIDWNISDRHRANIRYNKTEQTEPIYPNFSATQLALSSNLYTTAKTVETAVAQVFSDWTNNFSTELKVSKRDYEQEHRTPVRSPQVQLSFPGALPAGVVAATGTRSFLFGTEQSRQLNFLDTKTVDAYAGGTWFLREHEVKFGADFSQNKISNAFVNNTFGNYTFSCINSSTTYTYSFGVINCGTATAAQVEAATLENFRIGRPSSYQVQVAAPGLSLSNAVGKWQLSNFGYFVQDTWTVNKSLSVMFGARIDVPKTSDKPLANAAAAAPLIVGSGLTRNSGGFGRDNTNTIDGVSLFQPRVGFNYTFDSKRPMQLRGGFGLFQGAASNVWLTNPYQNPGVTTRVIGCGTGAFAACPTVGGTFSANPDAQPLLPGTTPAANVDYIDKDLGQPSVWKANLAFEHQLPWWGMVASAEFLYTKTNTGIYYQHLNLGGSTRAGPDGRQMFWTDQGYNPACWTSTGGQVTTGACTGIRARSLSNPNFANVLLAAKTKEGGGNQATVQLGRPMMQGWSWSVAYTYTTSKEVSGLTSSIANSNWTARAILNPNEDVASNSNYLIKDRVNGSLMWERAFIGKYKTRVGFFAEGRRGKPYSWVYVNDQNGDGQFGNDLMYIPRGPGSGEVVFLGDTATSRTNEDAFWGIVNSTGINTRGGVVKRNDSFNPWTNTLDMRVTQELPGFVKEHKSVISLDLFNVGNLLNKKWGRIDEAPFPSTRSFVNYVGVDPQGRYVYALRNTGVTDFTTRQVRLESQWQAQVTFRYEF